MFYNTFLTYGLVYCSYGQNSNYSTTSISRKKNGTYSEATTSTIESKVFPVMNSVATALEKIYFRPVTTSALKFELMIIRSSGDYQAMEVVVDGFLKKAGTVKELLGETDKFTGSNIDKDLLRKMASRFNEPVLKNENHSTTEDVFDAILDSFSYYESVSASFTRTTYTYT